MYDISLTVFFPCYNEEKNIASLVRETAGILSALVKNYEILIVNDGSTDNTASIADSLSKEYPQVRVIHHKTNKGYGGALISGFTHAAYDWVFFTDGDNQFHMQEIGLLLSEAGKYDAVIGFRKVRRDPPHRILYARTWNMLIRLFLGLAITDLNCAFKLIRKSVLAGTPLISSGAMISAELLLRAKLAGARFKEVGVSHKPRQFGRQTGGNPKVILRALLELFRLYKEYRLTPRSK